MKDTYIEADHCIQEALQGGIVHLNDNLYFLSAETALQQVLIPEHVCCTELYRVCRRPLFLRECPDEKSKIYP